MRVMVTGGAGFIGSHLVDALLVRNHDVLVLDNMATGSLDNLAPHPSLDFREGSVADGPWVARAFADFMPQVVVHAAASYRDPDAWAEDILVNTVGTAHVARAARDVHAGRFIYLETSLCYGLHPQEQPITLAHPLAPEGSSYAISKTLGEQILQLAGLESLVFRLANIYGPRGVNGVLPIFYKRMAAGQPCQVMATRRDFVFVLDLVDLLVASVEGQGAPGAYHVASGHDYAIEEVHALMAGLLGVQVERGAACERNPDDVATILLDPSHKREVFGWQPRTALAQGVAATVASYREGGVRRAYTHLRGLASES